MIQILHTMTLNNTHRFLLTPIPISTSQNPCHESSNQYTNQPLTEINALRGIAPRGTHQRTYSHSSTVSSVDYATRMEVQNGTWAEQMVSKSASVQASMQPTPWAQHHTQHALRTHLRARRAHVVNEPLPRCANWS